MNRKGVTLIELLVVIGIMSILLGIASLSFNQWMQRRNVERDIKELYADLMFFRHQSVVNGVRHRLQLPAANMIAFRRYSAEGDMAGTEVRRRTLSRNMSRSAWLNPSPTEIEFNSRGVMPDIAAKTLCINSDSEPSVDAIYITSTKINIAKIRNHGGVCGRANIDFR